jgi:hypothetical protein
MVLKECPKSGDGFCALLKAASHLDASQARAQILGKMWWLWLRALVPSTRNSMALPQLVLE